MKKLFSLVIAAMFALTIAAQEHMKFKGIEITGKLSDFSKELKQQGFTLVGETERGCMYMGDFGGQNAFIVAYGTPISHTTYAAAALYEGSDQWTILKNQYTQLKDRLIAKYGKPKEVVEEFVYPYSESFNPVLAFKHEKATYKTRFEQTNGFVTLSIGYYEGLLVVALAYLDSVGDQLNESESSDDL